MDFSPTPAGVVPVKTPRKWLKRILLGLLGLVAFAIIAVIGAVIWVFYLIGVRTTIGDENWSEELKRAVEPHAVPALSGGRVLYSGFGDSYRMIWVYGDPAEVKKLISLPNMTFCEGSPVLEGERIPESVAAHMTREDFNEAGYHIWTPGWKVLPGSDPPWRYWTKYCVSLSKKGDSAMIYIVYERPWDDDV